MLTQSYQSLLFLSLLFSSIISSSSLKNGDVTDSYENAGCVETRIMSSSTDPKLRFLAIGDFGVGDETQAQVAEVLNSLVTRSGRHQTPVDFILSTGDQIYPNGVKSDYDVRFQQFFEDMYTYPSHSLSSRDIANVDTNNIGGVKIKKQPLKEKENIDDLTTSYQYRYIDDPQEEIVRCPANYTNRSTPFYTTLGNHGMYNPTSCYIPAHIYIYVYIYIFFFSLFIYPFSVSSSSISLLPSIFPFSSNQPVDVLASCHVCVW